MTCIKLTLDRHMENDFLQGSNLFLWMWQILHLRGQLLMLKRCKDNKVEDDLAAPLI